MASTHNICLTCKRGVKITDQSAKCTICYNIYHQKCLPIYDNEDIQYARDVNSYWTCPKCLLEIFPLNNLEDEEIVNFLNSTREYNINRLDELLFDPFELSEEGGVFDEIDPDENHLSVLASQTVHKCKYYLPNQLKDKIEKKSTTIDLSILHLNIRSTKKNFSELQILLNTLDYKFNYIALTESWLKPHNANLYDIEGFNHEYITREEKIGGGISLYIKDGINYKTRTDLGHSTNDLEMIWAEINNSHTKNQKNLILGVVYRRPGSDIEMFNTILAEKLDTINLEGKEVIYTGDFNIDLFKTNSHNLTNEFLEMNFTHAMSPIISKPTRVTSNTATLIDNFFIKSIGVDPIIGILPIEISDHYPICYITFEPKNNIDKNEPIYKRDFTKKNVDKFNQLMKDRKWDEVLNEGDTQRAYDLLHTYFTNDFKKCFPYKKVSKQYITRLPWLSEGLKTAIKIKHKLYTKNFKNPTSNNKKDYVKYKNKLQHLLRIAERKFYQDEMTKNQNNLRQSWKTINMAINRRKKAKFKTKYIKVGNNRSDNHNIIADHFNNFFTNVGITLDNKIPKADKDPLSFIQGTYEKSIFLVPCDEYEVNKIIDKLKDCATGWDEIPSTIIKENKRLLSGALVHIINLSLEQGYFPQQLKLANIIPIFKSGDEEEVGNYRPVSLLTTFSKIFERIFYDRLKSFLKLQKILFELQFGFREEHSTYMAITILMDKIIKALENGHYVIGLFLDFSKAFDTVNHQILLKKMHHYGIRGVANDWIASYLNNRQQYCTFNTQSSRPAKVKCGVPQGSILGPLLFLVYINDLGTVSKTLTSILFADDSNLFAEGNDLKKLQETVNSEIPVLTSWLRTNRLSLNIKKTHIMVFGKIPDQVKKQVAVVIDGYKLDVVKNTKFLGLLLDDCLNWKDHVNYIAQKLAKSIGILAQARKVLDRKTLKQLYYSFIYPYINYCNLTWGNSNETTLWPIFRLQKIALRIVFNIRKRNTTRDECKRAILLRLPDIHLLNIGIFMFKYNSKKLPGIFDDFFRENRTFHRYETRNATNLRIPRVKTTLADKFIRKTGVKFWNEIKENLDTEVSLQTFKKLLKKYLVNKY